MLFPWFPPWSTPTQASQRFSSDNTLTNKTTSVSVDRPRSSSRRHGVTEPISRGYRICTAIPLPWFHYQTNPTNWKTSFFRTQRSALLAEQMPVCCWLLPVRCMAILKYIPKPRVIWVRESNRDPPVMTRASASLKPSAGTSACMAVRSALPASSTPMGRACLLMMAAL